MATPAQSIKSPEKLSLACDITLQHFGVVPHLVVSRLLKLGPATITQLAHHCSTTIPSGLLYDHSKLRRALIVLIHHGAVGFQTAAPTVYYCMPDALVMRIKHPWILQNSKKLFGDEGEQIVKVLLQHGRACEESVLEFAMTDPTGPFCHLPHDATARKKEHLQKQLADMITNHFIEVSPKIHFVIQEETTLQPLEKFDATLEKKGKKKGQKRKREEDSFQHESPLEEIIGKEGAPMDVSEGGDETPVLLRVNKVKYLHHQRSCDAIDLVKRVVNDNASHLVECMLKYPQRVSAIPPSDIYKNTCTIPPMPKNSHPLREEQLVNLTTFPEVSERMREILGGLSAGLAHLNNFPILKHVSLQQGYAVNMGAITACLRDAQLEFILGKKFTYLGRRIFKILLQKKALEEKDIVSQALASETDVRQHMYRMKVMGYLSVREVPMTADMNPNKTIFLWHVPYEAVHQKVLNEMYKTLRNMHQKRLHAAKAVAPLLSRMNSSGKAHGLTDAQLAEVTKWNTMSDGLSFTIVSLYDAICSLEFF